MVDETAGLLPPVLRLGPDTTAEEATWLGATLRLLAREAKSDRPGSETLLSRLIDVLFVQLVRAWIETRAAHSTAASGGWLAALRDARIGAALSAIHREPHRDWTVAALAREVGLSRSAFAARFSTLVGESPLSYLNRWRMHVATDLLTRDGLSLSEVAGRVGYESEAAFSRAFKQRTGMPPGTARGARRGAA